MSSDPNDCMVGSPAQDGPGVSDHDYILYIMADQSRCPSENIVAFASVCLIESVQDRPIMGMINYCSDFVRGRDPEFTFSVTKHEVLHALGFSRLLMSFWRDPANNQPRTPRNPVTNLPPFIPSAG